MCVCVWSEAVFRDLSFGINSFIHIISVTQSQHTTTLSNFLGILVLLAVSSLYMLQFHSPSSSA